MSTRYSGGVITKTPVVPAGPYETGAAPGIWTLDQQLQAAKAGIWPLAGNVPNYIEDVFSTYLYTGNNTTLPIVNGIDLSTKGGLVWLKARNAAGYVNRLYDTVRGANTTVLFSDLTNGATAATNQINSFNSNGFTLGSNANTNDSAVNYATWTFREQPKFFDIVTYTGTGSNATISHNLGSEPGCIIVKRTDAVASWYVYHRGLSGIGNKYIILNSTAAEDTGFFWTPTSTTFNVSSTLGLTATGGTYVAYLFAHNAGGFGLTGTDNVISCGSLTMGAGITTATLGYEPQWLLIKGSNNANEWWLIDNMRGLSQANYARLFANSSAAESVSSGPYILPTATGFTMDGSIFGSGNSFIYIAIRRGPMKVPTSGTSVYQAVARAGTGANDTISGIGFTPDLWIDRYRAAGPDTVVTDRLRGISPYLATNLTTAESGFGGSGNISFDMSGVTVGTGAPFNASGNNYINWFFQRAPGFFDEVCYTGSNGYQDLSHNLGTTPQMIIIKNRTSGQAWNVGVQGILGTGKYLVLNTTAAVVSDASYYGSPWTSTTFLVDGNLAPINQSGSTYVAYLFATVAGVSKVGSYTGTGTTQTINCGFTAGARFVLIKRTDSTGGWYVWDSARGIVAGNDPYLLLNSTAAEVTSTDYVDTAASGFEISSTAPAAINANGGSFIFLAIA